MAVWIKMTLGMKVDLSPGHIVLDEDQFPPKKGHSPHFRPMSTEAKWSPISATAENLVFFLCLFWKRAFNGNKWHVRFNMPMLFLTL